MVSVIKVLGLLEMLGLPEMLGLLSMVDLRHKSRVQARLVTNALQQDMNLTARLRKTKHCVVRPLNILCSDQFIQRLISSDGAATRDQIDAGEVGVQHRTNTIDYKHLFAVAANDPRFADIDPSHVVEHETAKLFDTWKKVYGNYAKAYAKFFVSGQNSEEFYNFCSGDLDVAFLRVCVAEKPELEAFVRGGMHEQDEIDSLGLAALPPPSTKPSKWQDQVLKTVNWIADIFVRAPAVVAPPSIAATTPAPHEEDVLIDRIAKLHQLIDQVKESQRKSEQSGYVDSTLVRCIGLYQQRLQHYESQLASLY
ncbi:hypothetical protein PHYSODRAFT_316085 [Phytophthora sojae]|uniref:Uncharacterized protein n=1 Tax=Phytophthora sojae (strain P6497) TaxID=1094619 RepID=G4ZLB6_PHYSP|nr:hypothetical protein PHYSODRAFT_316085 [Phytophthora sojae]EGZ15962.1 hypothetical protein PHYSODRAFT_316085 [Phytophthora sojae]|eukprot:XP_009529711.1 hypothetical protein PHYSODRAFT_316085 [Phytophthora sojae]